MALKSTIYKADLQIADMDRHYYQDHSLTLARHPSETDERLMVRLLAFVRHANESLIFAKGLSDVDEPDLWQKDLTGAIDLWIDVGQPDERRIRKASGRAAEVFVYSYGVQGARVWWDQTAAKVEKARNVTVIRLPGETRQLAALAERNMQLTCTIQDRHVWLTNGDQSVEIALETLKGPT